eukprot:TRINITY_DN4184_c0_g1_i1.p1 TRINITY_DN4184_c0_g1~~TRINITY_DN4184_c0_g1_i1.p1  ORF type:complete len:411 (+),score=72.28 TRINITY_DN4184_c0_g1_i1:42-1274(+)
MATSRDPTMSGALKVAVPFLLLVVCVGGDSGRAGSGLAEDAALPASPVWDTLALQNGTDGNATFGGGAEWNETAAQNDTAEPATQAPLEGGETNATDGSQPSGNETDPELGGNTESPGNQTETDSPVNQTGTDSPGNQTETDSPVNQTGTESPGNQTETDSPFDWGSNATEIPGGENVTDAPDVGNATEAPAGGNETGTEISGNETDTEAPGNMTDAPDSVDTQSPNVTDTEAPGNMTEAPGNATDTDSPIEGNVTDEPITPEPSDAPQTPTPATPPSPAPATPAPATPSPPTPAPATPAPETDAPNTDAPLTPEPHQAGGAGNTSAPPHTIQIDPDGASSDGFGVLPAIGAVVFALALLYVVYKVSQARKSKKRRRGHYASVRANQMDSVEMHNTPMGNDNIFDDDSDF